MSSSGRRRKADTDGFELKSTEVPSAAAAAKSKQSAKKAATAAAMERVQAAKKEEKEKEARQQAQRQALHNTIASSVQQSSQAMALASAFLTQQLRNSSASSSSSSAVAAIDQSHPQPQPPAEAKTTGPRNIAREFKSLDLLIARLGLPKKAAASIESAGVPLSELPELTEQEWQDVCKVQRVVCPSSSHSRRQVSKFEAKALARALKPYQGYIPGARSLHASFSCRVLLRLPQIYHRAILS